MKNKFFTRRFVSARCLPQSRFMHGLSKAKTLKSSAEMRSFMLNAFYSMIREIVAFTLIVSLLGSLTSHTDYDKYIRFFSGIIFILIVLKPVGNLLLGDLDFEKIMENNLLQYERRELEEELQIADEKTGAAVLNNYQESLEKDMETRLVKEGYSGKVSVSLYTDEEHYGEIYKVSIELEGAEEGKTEGTEAIEPIKIEEIAVTDDGDIFVQNKGYNNMEEGEAAKLTKNEKEIRKIICTFYDIEKSRISFP